MAVQPGGAEFARLAEARGHFEESVRLYGATSAADPGNASHRRHLADCRYLLGQVALREGNTASAIVEFGDALRLYDSLSGTELLAFFGHLRGACLHGCAHVIAIGVADSPDPAVLEHRQHAQQTDQRHRHEYAPPVLLRERDLRH